MTFRPIRRHKQQLPDEECIRILTEEKRGILALLGDEGYPYTVPLNFVYDNGKIYFHCAKEGHKLDALKSCDKVSFCVYQQEEKTEDDWAYHIRSVIVFGRAKLLTDREEIIEKCRLLGLKYYPNAQDVEKEIEKDGSRAACIELIIEHMTGKRIYEK
ncbi:MAG: pyridoxamine 5'-phosphate oxidase family protein [Ruminococcus sp.]|nr:pyridoxamine 5'-phosphate oxidase family protein [Ruminococcus sp.]